MQTVDDKTVISGLRWYTSYRYKLLITVGGVGCVGDDFSQIAGLALYQMCIGRPCTEPRP